MSADPADHALVARLRQRHPGAFDELYRQHRERVWRFVRQLASRQDLAEEIFQDTWVAAARHAHRLHEDTRLVPWLLTIARNKHRNAVRLQLFDERRRQAAGLEPLSPPRPPDVEADHRQQAQRVVNAFTSLPETWREVLLLSVVEGLETEEVARILELRPEAVRKRLSRARAELQRLTQQKDEVSP